MHLVDSLIHSFIPESTVGPEPKKKLEVKTLEVQNVSGFAFTNLIEL